MATKKKKKTFASKKVTARSRAAHAKKRRAAAPPTSIRKPQPKKSRAQTKTEPVQRPLPGVFHITAKAYRVLRDNWIIFLGVTVVYFTLNLLFVHGFGANIDINGLKNTIQNNNAAHSGTLATTATLFTYLLTSNGSATETGGIYQTFFVILVSLAIIWALREVFVGTKVRIRDSYYKSTRPLVPFITVLLVMTLQTIPLLIAAWGVTTIIGGGIAVTFNEKVVVVSVTGLLSLISFYLLSSSVFALYIVTLPDMKPLQALRAARKLVKGRRWLIMRKLLFLPLLLIVLVAIGMLPFLLFMPHWAAWVYFVLTMFVPLVIHTYVFTLYREML